MKVVIIGGVAGGASAAARIRRLDEHAEIIVFERSGYVSYANCGLPYYVGDVITDESKLTLQTPQSFWKRFRIDIRIRHEVTDIQPQKKMVTVRNLTNDAIIEESYDKLVLAPGAAAVRPNLPHLDDPRMFTLRTVEDTFTLHNFAKAQKPRNAVVIGGGFIGIEAAENLAKLGIAVTIVEFADQVLGILDSDIACAVQSKLKSQGIQVLLKSAVTDITARQEGLVLSTSAGHSLCCDMALLAIGVTPDTILAKKAGIALGIKDSIIVNDRMETSVPDIYAVGDAVEVTQYISGKKTLIALAGPANKQGRIAADNICGGDSRFRGSQGSSIVKIFDLTVAATGLNEKTAAAAGFDYDKVILSPNSHATYYPGATLMTMKILYEKNTLKLLGAQIVGHDGVDKRIDVLATCMHAGLPASRLQDLDLAYAPPYSSAKDPVNMAGYIIDNIVNGTIKQFHYQDMQTLPRDGSVTLLDVRTDKEYSEGHIAGTTHIPLDTLRERVGELPQDKPVYIMCRTGLRSYIACRILMQRGFDCYNFSGGFLYYQMVAQENSGS